MTTWTVHQLSELTGLTIRTLHHYDRIGLLTPGSRSPAGYRQYHQIDLDRLQQVLFFRELGFPLGEIRRIMTASDFDRQEALKIQRALLERKLTNLRAMLDAVDLALDRRGKVPKPTEARRMFTMFESFDPTQYEEEAQKRWGETEAWYESKRRTAKYDKAQFKKIAEEADAIARQLANLFKTGTPATAPSAMDLAEQHRQHIDRWFYACSMEMHANLGQMYVEDPRFSAFYDRFEEGLAIYVRDAIVANAQRKQKKGRT